MKPTKEQLILSLKGFAMGTADIVPGVSGGTVALITGVYDNLINSISSVNKDFVKLLIGFKIREALIHLNAAFLFPLLAGIFVAIIGMSKIMHFFQFHFGAQRPLCSEHRDLYARSTETSMLGA